MLVPVGDLGTVPWHAARHAKTGDYACESAAFSYASSGQQFIDATLRQPRPWAESPVIVASAENGITGSAVGRLFTEHYQAASVFGSARESLPGTVPGSAAATPGDVMSAIRGAWMLFHFACPGRVQVPACESSLPLGVNQVLSVRTILRSATTWQPRHESRNGSWGLAIIPSCPTDATGSDYDQALTLGPVIVAAGASGVVTALWETPDRATAQFMSAFHQYLSAGLSPALALSPGATVDTWPSRPRPGQAWRAKPDSSRGLGCLRVRGPVRSHTSKTAISTGDPTRRQNWPICARRPPVAVRTRTLNIRRSSVWTHRFSVTQSSFR